MEKEFDIEELKKEYEKFKIKYSLPDFSEMNKQFDIEEIEKGEFFIRKIRRVISERVTGYMRFVEVILNPANAPLFFFKLIKKLDNNDKTILNEIYERLGVFEIDAVKLDLDYSEENEANFIKKVYSVFIKDIKEKMLCIVGKMNNSSDSQKETGSSYCG